MISTMISTTIGTRTAHIIEPADSVQHHSLVPGGSAPTLGIPMEANLSDDNTLG